MERSHAKGRQAEIQTTRDDPAIGRFLEIDPLAALAPGLTPYHYVRNNPINRVDLFGLTDGDVKDGDKMIPCPDGNCGETETIVVEAERYQGDGYIWAGGSYYLIDETQREFYEKLEKKEEYRK